MPERRERGEREERFPPPEHMQAILINPDLLARSLADYLSSRPVIEEPGDQFTVPEISKEIIGSIREIRSIVMRNQLRHLPQSTLSISSKKAFIESSKQMIMSTLSILAATGEGYVTNIYKGLEVLASGAVSKDERVKAAEMVYKTTLSLIGMMYAFPVIIKDLSGVSELSLPFHIASDMVRKNLGYTGTQ